MSNENFRRELNHVFDQMTGSPSPALRDRVRSSVGEVPIERGPYWIAAVAAVLIAVVIVGILFVANPLRRPPISVGPGPSTPTPSASPAASPTAEANLPPFSCLSSSTHFDYPQDPSQAQIDVLRTGTHPGYDRLTIEWKTGISPTGPTNIEFSTQSGTSFTQGASGQTVTLQGKNGILVVIHNADLHTSYSGSTDIKTDYSRLVEVRRVEDFEGTVQLALGINGPACYRAFYLTNPQRLVIDIQAG